MKLLRRSFGPFAAIALPFLTLGCGDDEATETPEDPKKATSSKSRPKGNRPKPTPEGPAWQADAKRLQRQIIGYWAFDEQAMAEDLRKQMEGSPEEAIQQALTQMGDLVQNSAIQIESDQIILTDPNSTKPKSYAATNAEPDENLLHFKGEASGKNFTGTAKIEGENLTLTMSRGELFHLNRIAENEHALLVEKAKNYERPSVAPPIPIPPIPTPPDPGPNP